LLADVIAQSIYAVYSRAFPLSVHRFNDEFKRYLVNTVHDWVIGELCQVLLIITHKLCSLYNIQLYMECLQFLSIIFVPLLCPCRQWKSMTWMRK